MKNIFFSYVFYACFFCRPHYIFFQIDQKFFYFVALINFSRNLSNVFFYFVAFNNFSKNMVKYFFS